MDTATLSMSGELLHGSANEHFTYPWIVNSSIHVSKIQNQNKKNTIVCEKFLLNLESKNNLPVEFVQFEHHTIL